MDAARLVAIALAFVGEHRTVLVRLTVFGFGRAVVIVTVVAVVLTATAVLGFRREIRVVARAGTPPVVIATVRGPVLLGSFRVKTVAEQEPADVVIAG